MNAVAQLFAAVVAAVHLLVFAWETILFERPGVYGKVFRIPAKDVPAVRLWTFGQGFYNLFLASGTIAGLIALTPGT